MLYLGIDQHQRQLTVNLRNEAGDIVLRRQVSTEWERVRVRAYECPRIQGAFLEEERVAMGERWFRQEYLCEFVDSVSGVFERNLVEEAITGEFEPLRIL